MRKKYFRVMLCLALLLLSLPELFAQKDTVSNYKRIIGLKFVPLPLFDVVSSVQFGLEVPTFKHQAFQLEYAFPVNLWNRSQAGEKISKLSGFKLKTEYRFYNKNAWMPGVFYGLQYMYKVTKTNDETFLWLNNRSYQQLLPIGIKNETHAGYILIGKVYPFFDKLFVELATGIGLRILEIKLEDLPPNSEPVDEINRNIFSNTQGVGTYHTPALFLSAKVVWPLWKAKVK